MSNITTITLPPVKVVIFGVPGVKDEDLVKNIFGKESDLPKYNEVFNRFEGEIKRGRETRQFGYYLQVFQPKKSAPSNMTEFIKNADGTIFILDLTNAQSFELIKRQIGAMGFSAEYFEGHNTILLANKWDDSKSDAVNQEEAKQFAKDFGLHYRYLSTNKDIKKYLKDKIISFDQNKFYNITYEFSRNKGKIKTNKKSDGKDSCCMGCVE